MRDSSLLEIPNKIEQRIFISIQMKAIIRKKKKIIFNWLVHIYWLSSKIREKLWRSGKISVRSPAFSAYYISVLYLHGHHLFLNDRNRFQHFPKRKRKTKFSHRNGGSIIIPTGFCLFRCPRRTGSAIGRHELFLPKYAAVSSLSHPYIRNRGFT